MASDRNTYKHNNGISGIHPMATRPSSSGVAGPAMVSSKRGMSDDELLRLGPRELLGRLRKLEVKNAKLAAEQNSLVKDANQRMQMYLMETRGLKEANLRLQDDNQELRDLCCFLDDDRQKGRKLAREWQRFGRYTASVMRQEVSTYQTKLQELESKQQELIKDNLELKELCLYLDEERASTRGMLCSHCGLPIIHSQRDDGDGSSSSTNNEEAPIPFSVPVRTGSREKLLEDNLQRQRSIINEQVLHYIRGLERRVQQLEQEQKPKPTVNDNDKATNLKPLQPPPYRKPPCPPTESRNANNYDSGFGKPEAVVHAMKVLEVHEQFVKPLSNSSSSEIDDLADNEKALVREMCNVVWRKLEDGSDHIP